MKDEDVFDKIQLFCTPYAGTHIYNVLKKGLQLSLNENREVIIVFNDREYIVNAEEVIAKYIANQIPVAMVNKGE